MKHLKSVSKYPAYAVTLPAPDAARLRAGMASATGSIRSVEVHSNASHNAIKIRNDNRSGVWVTNR